MQNKLRSIFSHSYESNIPKGFVYTFFYNSFYIVPIWAIFLHQERGLTISQVTWTDIAFFLTMALAEIPTGVVADTVGRKASMMISTLINVFAAILFATATTFPMIMIANSLWAIGLTFNSGAEVTLFFETIKQVGRESEFIKLRGRLQVVMMAGAAFSSGLGGILGNIDLQLPFFVYAATNVLSFLVLLTMKDTPIELDEETGVQLPYRETVKVSWRAFRQRPILRYALLYGGMIIVGEHMIRVLFIQLHAVEIGMPISLIGFWVFGYQFAQMLGAASANRLEKRLGEWKLLVFGAGLVVVGLLVIGVIPTWVGLALFALASFAVTLIQPTKEKIILSHAPRAVRATILSIDSLIFQVMTVFFEPWIGLIGEKRGLADAFVALALISLVLLGVVLTLWRRAWQPVSEPASA